MTGVPILTLLVALPLIGALVVGLLNNRDGSKDGQIRWLALGITAVPFVLSLLLWASFDAAASGAPFQFVERHAWIPTFGIDYYVGIDGISLMLVVLTTFLTPIALLTSWESIHERVKEFTVFMLLLEAAMIGVFVSLDLFLFYVFWDFMLIPMYFLIGIWGYDQRLYASIKFLLYTMAGSVLMLLAIIGMAWLHQQATGQYSFDLLKLYELRVPEHLQYWFFLAFAVAFAIKVPLFPFHTWLPDAHVQAPTPGSVILAGVLLKMGTYGILRINYPILPAATLEFAFYLLIALGTWNIVYGALCAMAQTDFKKLIAYSSISHMGYVMFGMATMTSEGINGAVLQMFNHGTVTAMLFLLVGVIYDRAHHREINGFGGLAGIMPFYTGWTALAFFAAMGLPGLSAFISEVLVLLGGWRNYPALTIVSASAVVLTAGYMLWTLQRIYLGKANEKYVDLPDINGREIFTLVPLGIIVIVLGVYPRPVLDLINVSLVHLNQVVAGKAQVALATAANMVP